MNFKRWILASLVATIAVLLLESIYENAILGPLYAASAHLWRSRAEMGTLMPLGFIGTLLSTFVLVYIYHRGYEGRGSRALEGLRFGFIMGLFTAVPMSLWTYVMMPVPKALMLGWFAIGMMDMLLAGFLIGLIYEPKKA